MDTTTTKKTDIGFDPWDHVDPDWNDDPSAGLERAARQGIEVAVRRAARFLHENPRFRADVAKDRVALFQAMRTKMEGE